MAEKLRRSLEEYLSLGYPFKVIADPEGGYVIEFPDLPGCLTQVETAEEIGATAEDARRAWITVAYEEGIDIPLPSYPEEHSGKFNVRLPRSLHAALVAAAERDEVSLNTYVVRLLSERNVQYRVERELAMIGQYVSRLNAKLSYQVSATSFSLSSAKENDAWIYGAVMAA